MKVILSNGRTKFSWHHRIETVKRKCIFGLAYSHEQTSSSAGLQVCYLFWSTCLKPVLEGEQKPKPKIYVELSHQLSKWIKMNIFISLFCCPYFTNDCKYVYIRGTYHNWQGMPLRSQFLQSCQLNPLSHTLCCSGEQCFQHYFLISSIDVPYCLK